MIITEGWAKVDWAAPKQARQFGLEQAVQAGAIPRVEPQAPVRIKVVPFGAAQRGGEPDLLIGGLPVDHVGPLGAQLQGQHPILCDNESWELGGV